MHQMIEVMTSLIKEMENVEGPNFQEKSVQEKRDNQKVGHLGRSKLISYCAQIKPFMRQIDSPKLNSRANPTDLVDVSNLNHLSGKRNFIKGPTK